MHFSKHYLALHPFAPRRFGSPGMFTEDRGWTWEGGWVPGHQGGGCHTEQHVGWGFSILLVQLNPQGGYGVQWPKPIHPFSKTHPLIIPPGGLMKVCGQNRAWFKFRMILFATKPGG